MQPSILPQAVAAAIAVCSAQGLAVDDASVLHNSNKLTLRLQPSDVVARVAPGTYDVSGLEFEVDLARRLVEAGCPVVAVDARVEPVVYDEGGFTMTFWTSHEPSTSTIPDADYARALERLHQGMRFVDAAVPHFTDRVESAQQLVASPDRTPTLGASDRQFLSEVLRDLRAKAGGRGADQLLHGEPHPGNLLDTSEGPLFIDLETCCRGPVEFDLAHAPQGVSEHYPGVDHELLTSCRLLMLAMITTWRWDVDDEFPDGHQRGQEWLAELRAARSMST